MLMTDEDRDAHDAHLARYYASRVAHVIGRIRDVEARRRDGTVFPAQLSVGAVLEQNLHASSDSFMTSPRSASPTRTPTGCRTG